MIIPHPLERLAFSATLGVLARGLFLSRYLPLDRAGVDCR